MQQQGQVPERAWPADKVMMASRKPHPGLKVKAAQEPLGHADHPLRRVRDVWNTAQYTEVQTTVVVVTARRARARPGNPVHTTRKTPPHAQTN
jgi:hypothetical protein